METQEQVISRDNERLKKYYEELLEGEKDNDHVIVLVNGVFRWKEDEKIINRLELLQKTWGFDLNMLCIARQVLGLEKNCKEMRRIYRGLGYSLGGYMEVFYE